MTTRVVDQVAELLGDTIDRSHYLWRTGERLTKLPGAQMWCDNSGQRKAQVMHT